MENAAEIKDLSKSCKGFELCETLHALWELESG